MKHLIASLPLILLLTLTGCNSSDSEREEITDTSSDISTENNEDSSTETSIETSTDTNETSVTDTDSDTDSSVDSTPEPLTGKFLEIDLLGLSYHTDSYSGSLVNNEFEYLEGETISITFLGKTLIEFEGKSEVSISDLVADFPNDSNELNSSYFEGEGSDEFKTLANMFQLLAALDEDENPENGFDVSKFHELTSSSTELNLTLSPDTFYRQTLIELANEISANRNVSPTTSIGFLYELSKEEMVFSTTSYFAYDVGNDGTDDSTLEYVYSSEGYLLNEIRTNHTNGTASHRVLTTDEFTRLTQLAYPSYDSNGDKTYERGVTYTYNALGQITEELTYLDHDGDGENDSTSSITFNYNAKGLVTSETSLDDSSKIVYTYLYNGDRSLSSYTEIQDTNNDDTPEQTKEYSFQYNSDGTVLEERVDIDNDADGTIDEYEISTYSYDANSKETLRETFQYDSDDTLTRKEVEEQSYDEYSNRTDYRYTIDFDGDGTDNYLFTTSYTLDENGNTVTKTSLTYRDGINLSKTVRTVYATPELGLLSDVSVYQDNNGDGTEDESYSWVNTFDEYGNYESRLYLDDDDNDGTVDSENMYSYTSIVLENGAAAFFYANFVSWN